jgi:hypothetical protein
LGWLFPEVVLMANTPATGNGPFEFTSSAGKQISIPLSAFTFDAAGNIVVDSAWQPLTNAQPGSALLAHAVKEGLIAPTAVASPFPAMIIKAADPGAGGNNITVTVVVSTIVTSPPTNDPTLVPFSLTVAENDNYTGLTAATVENVLGSSAVTGSSPGLVQVVHGSVDPTGVPTLQNGVLLGSPAEFDVVGSGSPGTVFILMAKRSGDSGPTKIKITPNVASPPSANPTFSLLVSWTRTVSGITLPNLHAMVQSALGYEITVSKPSSGAYSVPTAGVTTLSGGGPGSVASAVLFAGH